MGTVKLKKTAAPKENMVIISMDEAKGASKQEAAPVTVTKKTLVELHQQVTALENQNFELLTRLEALESMIVPTEVEIKDAPASSMLAASMQSVLSVVS